MSQRAMLPVSGGAALLRRPSVDARKGLRVHGRAAAAVSRRAGAQRLRLRVHAAAGAHTPLVLLAAGSAPEGFGMVGAAIELRSRLQQMDIELRGTPGGGGGWEEIEGAWVRVPSMRAWGVVHFMGGAVLGGFPHIVYDAWLARVCEKGGLIIVATPYELGTNHQEIAEAAAATRDRATAAVLQREMYPAAMPMFGVGHSLGAKLHILLACETREEKDINNIAVELPPRYAGHVLVAFNNASATDTVRLLENFARTLLRKQVAEGKGNSAMYEQILNGMPGLAAMAAQAAQAAGLEFVPNPGETLDRARNSLRSRFVRMVKFGEDDLDMNEELVEVLLQRFAVAYPGEVSTRNLAGNHLTPVMVRVQGGDVSPVMAQLGEINLGDEAAVNALADTTIELLQKA